jgi:hypothetical protein
MDLKEMWLGCQERSARLAGKICWASRRDLLVWQEIWIGWQERSAKLAGNIDRLVGNMAVASIPGEVGEAGEGGNRHSSLGVRSIRILRLAIKSLLFRFVSFGTSINSKK